MARTDAAPLDAAFEDREARAPEYLRRLGDLDGVAQVRLVAAVFEHGVVEADAREGRRRDAAPVCELLEHPGQHRLDGGEHVLLRHERHLEIELVELAGRAVGARVLVAEAGRDLEIAVEARDHQQLLELLRRLRQGVEIAGMQPRRHQEVAGSFRALGGQDRRLELAKVLLDHAPADGGDDVGAQRDVALHLVAAKVEEAVAQPHLLAIVLVAVHLQRQRLGGAQHGDLADRHLDLAGRERRVHRLGVPLDAFAGDRQHRFVARRVQHREGPGPARIDHALRQPVAVAQVHEQQAAVVALAVDPAREADGAADIGAAERAAIVCAVGVHGIRARLAKVAREWNERASLVKPRGRAYEAGPCPSRQFQLPTRAS